MLAIKHHNSTSIVLFSPFFKYLIKINVRTALKQQLFIQHSGYHNFSHEQPPVCFRLPDLFYA